MIEGVWVVGPEGTVEVISGARGAAEGPRTRRPGRGRPGVRGKRRSVILAPVGGGGPLTSIGRCRDLDWSMDCMRGPWHLDVS